MMPSSTNARACFSSIMARYKNLGRRAGMMRDTVRFYRSAASQPLVNGQLENRCRQDLVLVEFMEQIVDGLVQPPANVHAHAANDDKVPHRLSHGSAPYSDRDVM